MRNTAFACYLHSEWSKIIFCIARFCDTQIYIFMCIRYTTYCHQCHITCYVHQHARWTSFFGCKFCFGFTIRMNIIIIIIAVCITLFHSSQNKINRFSLLCNESFTLQNDFKYLCSLFKVQNNKFWWVFVFFFISISISQINEWKAWWKVFIFMSKL